MGIDSLGGVNTRVKLSVFDVTAAGFKVNMEAWWDSIVYGIWHTEPVLNPGLVRIFPLHSYETARRTFHSQSMCCQGTYMVAYRIRALRDCCAALLFLQSNVFG
jgi:hypothetical protein